MGLSNDDPSNNRNLASKIRIALYENTGILSSLSGLIEDWIKHQRDAKLDLDKRISAYLLMRRKRAFIFGEDLFADPAWDMMLDLYVADKVRRPISVSSCCIASGVPPTTALRWLSELEKRDLVRRMDDELDKRRSFVVLSPHAIDMIEAVWQHFGDN